MFGAIRDWLELRQSEVVSQQKARQERAYAESLKTFNDMKKAVLAARKQVITLPLPEGTKAICLQPEHKLLILGALRFPDESKINGRMLANMRRLCDWLQSSLDDGNLIFFQRENVDVDIHDEEECK